MQVIRGSRSFRAETAALTQLNERHAPVPRIRLIDEARHFAIVGPYGTPLRNQHFAVEVLVKASAVCVMALRAAAALPLRSESRYVLGNRHTRVMMVPDCRATMQLTRVHAALCLTSL